MKFQISHSQFYLLTEQKVQGKIYTNEQEYKKALVKYNKDLLVYNWLNDLEKFSKEFKNKDTTIFNYQEILLNRPYGKQISKAFPNTLTELIMGLSYAFTAFGRNKNQVDKDEANFAKKVYKILGLDIGKRIGKFPTLIFQGKNVYLPIYPKPEKPIYRPITPKPTSEPIIKPQLEPETKVEKNPTPKKVEPSLEGESVYGPGYHLIGTLKDKTFIPISDETIKTWAPNSPYTKIDSELLKDKDKLNQYLRMKFGGYINPIK